MAHPDTVEHGLLLPAEQLINSAIAGCENKGTARLSLLEQLVCMRSGISEGVYRSITGYVSTADYDQWLLERLASSIDESHIPFALALAALSRVETNEVDTKRNGAVYTDFRLATYLAKSVMDAYRDGPIIDPSCGTSIILAACAEQVQTETGNASSFVATCLFGIDLSALAIRGSLLSLVYYLQNSDQLAKLKSHFLCADSLELGTDILRCFGTNHFSVVVGNPPWERVKPSRSEYARERGFAVNYGTEIETMPDGYERQRSASISKARRLSELYGLKGGTDLYRAFLSLSICLCVDGGNIALYLPGGLIRSKSLAETRDSFLHGFDRVGLSVFMNQPRFFAIDSRFKFVLLSLVGKRNSKQLSAVDFRYCAADDHAVTVSSELQLSASLFSDKSQELGAPEVKNRSEVQVLKTIWNHGERMKEHPAFRDIRPVRELDMTLDRDLFIKAKDVASTEDMAPLIEGRMVSQFRCGCKEFISGAGRSAKWATVPIGSSKIVPQFFVSKSMLSDELLARVNAPRIGFCDIAGQTNERAMQAALIPSGCVCGNKVPTLCFNDRNAAFLWLGIANSFVFDWVVRRYITTTINYFILENLPFPCIGLESGLAERIIKIVNEIIDLEDGTNGWDAATRWEYANKRAELDGLSFAAYGLASEDFDTIVADFPLVDQVNNRLRPGSRPTIDLARSFVCNDANAYERARSAWLQGAMPYVPNEHMRSLLRIHSGV